MQHLFAERHGGKGKLGAGKQGQGAAGAVLAKSAHRPKCGTLVEPERAEGIGLGEAFEDGGGEPGSEP